MKTSRTAAYLTIAAVAALVGRIAFADAVAPANPYPFAAVDTGGTAETGHEAGYDFGTMIQGATAPVQHDFVLRNTSGSPVNIDRVQAACGCTTAMLDIGTPGNYKPVEPGQQFTVHVSIDPGHLFPPKADKQVMIYVKGFGEPAETLRITGTVSAAATFEPSFLNFGSIQAGSSPALKLKVAVDRSAFPDTAAVTSTDPDLKIKPDGDQPPSDATGHMRTTVYDVTVDKKHHLGPLQATIMMNGGTPSARGMYGASAWVEGNVTGDFSVTPASIAFGSTTLGRSTAQQVIVTATSKSVLDGLKVDCASRDMTAQLTPQSAAAAGSNPTAILAVSFTPTTDGSVQSQITLKTRSGQVMVLPVWAWVNKTTAAVLFPNAAQQR